jgi:hypothetical protein
LINDMSSPTIALSNYLPVTKACAESTTDAEDMLLQRGFCFHVTRRIDINIFSRWKRELYVYFCRKARPNLRVPPIIPTPRGVITSFIVADSECKQSDDQLHILPFGWLYSADELQADVVCRPRDESDTVNYERLKKLFGMPSSECGHLEEHLWVSQEYARALESVINEATSLFHRTLKSADDG